MIIFILLIKLAMAHGEDKFGPHGGYIRMPGAYHTEILMVSPHRVKVFLLDIAWENPTTKNSSVKIYHSLKKNSEALCRVLKNYYLCDFSKNVDLTKGELRLESERNGQKGSVAVYALPLALEKKHH